MEASPKKHKQPLFNRLPLHPLLLGFYPALLLWLVNFHQVPAFAVLRLLPYALVILAAACLLGWLVFRKPLKAALAGSLALALFYAYGHIFRLLEGVIPVQHRYLLPAWLILLVLGGWGIRRVRKSIFQWTHLINWVSIFLVVSTGVQLIYAQVTSPRRAQSAAVKPAAAQSGRDVYYILLDTYTRQDVLSQLYGYDNTPFIQELQALGFAVDPCAQANYDLTHTSMAATLNMDYMSALPVPIYPNLENEKIEDFEGLLKYSRVRAQFEALGYQFVTFKSVYPWLDISDSDIYYDPETAVDYLSRQEAVNFQYLYFQTTALRPLLELVEVNAERLGNLPPFVLNFLNPTINLFATRTYNTYKASLYAFEKLQQLPQVPGRKFVYAHLFSTHLPFVFNADGSLRAAGEESSEAYVGTIQYTNQRLLEILKTILDKTSPAPIIILQGDHGFAEGADHVKIFNAYFLPDGGAAKRYNGMTPVNTFRLVFDYYFNQNYGLLPDHSYHSPYRRPYQFDEIAPTCAS